MILQSPDGGPTLAPPARYPLGGAAPSLPSSPREGRRLRIQRAPLADNASQRLPERSDSAWADLGKTVHDGRPGAASGTGDASTFVAGTAGSGPSGSE